jgi:hypothetical protein
MEKFRKKSVNFELNKIVNKIEFATAFPSTSISLHFQCTN